jgi:hypothetical protein
MNHPGEMKGKEDLENPGEEESSRVIESQN